MEYVGLGLCWDELEVGYQFRTVGRTITEADLVNFINATGMTEVLFTDTEFLKEHAPMAGRVVPGALAYTFAEGLLVQSTMQHTGLAFLNTSTATSMAVLAWVGIEWLHGGKPTVLGAATGAVAGLVAITPACDAVTPLGSMAVGFGGGAICYAAVAILKPAMGYDDSLDVFGVHGVGGMWGAIATGLFIAEVTDAGWFGQVIKQIVSVGFTAVYAPLLTFGILLVLKALFGELRVEDDEESMGLDLVEHSETAYTN